VTDDRHTADMFPHLPRDPVRQREASVPKEVRDSAKWLREQAKKRTYTLRDQMELKKAAELLLEGWGGKP